MIEYKGKIYRQLVKSDLVVGTKIVVFMYRPNHKEPHEIEYSTISRVFDNGCYSRDKFHYRDNMKTSNSMSRNENESYNHVGFDHAGFYSHRYYIEVKK